MTFKQDGNRILCGDLPSKVVAVFTDELTEKAKLHLINDHNYGLKLIELTGQLHSSRIEEVFEFLKLLASEKENYTYEKLCINRMKE